jgi:hypothetical protein
MPLHCVVFRAQKCALIPSTYYSSAHTTAKEINPSEKGIVNDEYSIFCLFAHKNPNPHTGTAVVNQ